MRRDRRLSAAVGSAVLLSIAVACSNGEHRATSDRSTEAALRASVRVEADGCTTKALIGAGSFVADGKVLTVAHVVAGADEVHVVLADGSRVDAEVVAIDRLKDLAVLDVDSPTLPLPRGTMRPGTRGSFVVYRNEMPIAQQFEAMSFVDINAPDIDHGGSSLRRGYQLRAQVASGDSGAVLVADGVATGVVFARSTATNGKAWAVDISEADALLAAAAASNDAIDIGECV